MVLSEKNVATYYQQSWEHFVRWWHAEKTLGIHYGYYEKGIRTHAQAVNHMNDFVGTLLQLHPKKSMTVLDIDAIPSYVSSHQ